MKFTNKSELTLIRKPCTLFSFSHTSFRNVHQPFYMCKISPKNDCGRFQSPTVRKIIINIAELL